MNVPPVKLATDALAEFEVSAIETESLARDFLELTKARLNVMVLITTMIGFAVATPGRLDFWLLVQTLFGTGLCAAAASVLNQAWEFNHDAKMTRTARRPIPRGRMSAGDATLLGLVITVCGAATLAVTVNLTACILAVATIVLYVLVYTPLKRVTTWNTLVGAIPGAIPPVIGYVAASNGKIDLEAIGLFAILFCWQMPHFLAISILCREDYAKAGYKMMPVLDANLTRTSGWIVFFGLMLIVASLIPVWVRPTSLAYTIVAISLGGAFLATGIRCAAIRTRDAARVAFFASLIYLPLMLGALMVDRLL